MNCRINELFAEAKERLDILAVAERYGMSVDRHKKAVCPFHDDRHPSLSFKDGYFKCFACREGGDVFKLAGKLLGIEKPFEVLRQLNDDFMLGLDLTPHRQTAEERKQAAERAWQIKVTKAYQSWLTKALDSCIAYEKLLCRWREVYKPEKPNSTYHPLFVEAMQNYERVKYLVDILMSDSETEKQSLYQNCYQEVMKIEKRIKQYKSAVSRSCGRA